MASASTPTPHQGPLRPIAPRPALRPILPKPPSIAPIPTPTSSAAKPTQTSTTSTTTNAATSAISHLGSRVIGSVASSIFAGSTTITLPPRPSASRSKAKKRASPDRVPAPGLADIADKPEDSASSVAALKKRRRQKLSSISPASLSATSKLNSPTAPATRSAIAIPHVAPEGLRASATALGAYDGDALSPDAFTLPSAASDLWWPPRMDDSASSLPSLYESDISLPSPASSTLASATAAARRRLDRASSTSSLSSSFSSSAYFSDSTISTAVSSIVIDEEPSELEGEPIKRVESEISDMIHRLITGGESRERRSSVGSIDEDEDEMLFATRTDTSSVRKSRAESEDPSMLSARIRPRQTKPDPLRALFAMTPASLSSISSSTTPSSDRSPTSADEFSVTTPGTPIPAKHLNRSMSEPASITIPAEKNSFEDDNESEFILNREMLVRKGLIPPSRAHRNHKHTLLTKDKLATVVDDDDIVVTSGIANEDLFAEDVDDEDEMVSITTSHESRDPDIDIDLDGGSDVLFGGIDGLGLADDECDQFTFLDIVGDGVGNEVVESAVAW